MLLMLMNMKFLFCILWCLTWKIEGEYGSFSALASVELLKKRTSWEWAIFVALLTVRAFSINALHTERTFPLTREYISCRFSNIESINTLVFVPQYNFDPRAYSFQWCRRAITPRCSFLPKPDRVGKNTYVLDINAHIPLWCALSYSAAANEKWITAIYVLIEVCECSFRCSGARSEKSRRGAWNFHMQ